MHRNIKRPSSLDGFYFDNILLTDKGLRLIDVGISALRHKVSDTIFKKYIETENEELALFKNLLFKSVIIKYCHFKNVSFFKTNTKPTKLITNRL